MPASSNASPRHALAVDRNASARELTEDEIALVSGGSTQHKHLAGVKYEDITITCQRH